MITKLYKDQRAFNKLIWDREKFKDDQPAFLARLRDLTFGLIEESLEFIRTFDYKVHRRSKVRLQNVAHSHEELIDQFKYWLSLCDLADFPMERLEELYYAKSRVVRYRYQEEWLATIDGPSVIVDIDQVLADYLTGMCRWAREWGAQLMKLSPSDTRRLIENLDRIEKSGTFISSSSVGFPHLEWQKVKHDFRTRGGKQTLPVFPDAKPFLEWCRAQGWTIILITSRPVDLYPNIFTDTITWLTNNNLPFDFLWWANEKGERIEEGPATMRGQIVFAVDDSDKFVEQLRSRMIKTYKRDRKLPFDESDPTHNPLTVRSLHDLMEREKKMPGKIPFEITAE